MNREELLRLHEELCREAMGICKTEQGFLVRIVDKLSRLSTFVSCGKLKVENEGYKDAIVDIINYAVLLYGFTKQKEAEQNNVSYTITSSQFIQE